MTAIKTICLMLPLRLTTVNCFLVRAESGWILIDTACSINRAELDGHLEQAGCRPGNLRLIVLTHGDFDHTGNARHIRERFGSTVAMHRGDLGMVERGDMFWNRGKSNPLVKAIAPVLFGFGKSERFTPDVYVDDGDDLSRYGLDARIVTLPGHSKGSIGIVTGKGDLFCGDLLINEKNPVLNDRIADPGAARASVERLRKLGIATVFTSHGRQFPLKEFLK
jgi:hydroxyacylglutathione hydrolase